MKAFVFDQLWDQIVNDELLLRLSENGVEVVVTSEIAPLRECNELFEGNEARLLCLNPDYMGWKLSAEDYKDIPNLKGILIASTGYEWIEPKAAAEKNIPICNIRNFSTQAVAEWAVMMMFILARQTPRLIKDNFPLDYDKDFTKYLGLQLKGKTAGIIGLGHIGSAIAEACIGLGMNVVYWSKSSTNDSYKNASLDQLMSNSDVIFPTVVKNPETAQLITNEHIASVKKSAIIVDIAHGFFEQGVILDMVDRGDLFGYGFEGKPNEFTKFEGNVWAAPAYAWATSESMYNSAELLVDNIVSASKGEFPTRVN